MANVDPKTLGNLIEGARMANLMPAIEHEAGLIEKSIENRVKRLNDEGKLTPEEALRAWQEKIVVQTLVRRLNQRVRVGRAAGEALGEPLEIA